MKMNCGTMDVWSKNDKKKHGDSSTGPWALILGEALFGKNRNIWKQMEKEGKLRERKYPTTLYYYIVM